MDFEKIKRQANQILESQSAENSYIEYKASADQLDKILKTICAFGNNYYDNDLQFLFIGVEEMNTEEYKAIPKIPIKGIEEGKLEKCKNRLNRLRSFLYPNVRFEVVANRYDDKSYLLIICPRQTGGPFMVSEKAEKDKAIHLKPGRYVRIEADSRIAHVDEEYDLLRKFSNYHFSSMSTTDATLDDLDIDLMAEYVSKTSDREIMENLGKRELAKALNLLDRNDPQESRVKNYAVLMFCRKPERFLRYAYADVIVDRFGSKKRMTAKSFRGPVWKQYEAIIDFINNNLLDTLVLRQPGVAENRKIANFPFAAVEELVANALVHNNYENSNPIQIYLSEKEINIVNYNKPLPPLSIKDLNERDIFFERNAENPELRDMFKAIGIIESFGTGIGEAKNAMAENGSPQLYYKVFPGNENITSVVIPVNRKYLELTNRREPKENLGIESQTKEIKEKILGSNLSKNTKENMLRLFDEFQDSVFGNREICTLLKCSQTSATAYLKKMDQKLGILSRVEGMGKGKYRFLTETLNANNSKSEKE